jgi:hypothetical protein
LSCFCAGLGKCETSLPARTLIMFSSFCLKVPSSSLFVIRPTQTDDDGSTGDNSGGLSGLFGGLFGGGASKNNLAHKPHGANETIHVFSIASGHLYERFLNIMMLSVKRATQNPVKFWFVANFLSPQFKEFAPRMAKVAFRINY